MAITRWPSLAVSGIIVAVLLGGCPEPSPIGQDLPSLQVAAPVFSPDGVAFATSVDVQISCSTVGATAVYTLDGSDPGVSGLTYVEPLHLTSTTVLKAQAFKDGMVASNVVSATYTLSQPGSAASYSLSVQTQGQGSVNTASGDFASGTTLNLEALPQAGWRFDHWEGDRSGTQNPLALTITADTTIIAVFTEVPTSHHSLTVKVKGQGSVDPSGGDYPAETVVTLTASPASGWGFDRWEGDLSGSNNPAAVPLTADRVITAVFVEIPPIQHTLTTQVQGQGTVSPGSGSYADGSEVTLTANPAAGWRFDHWQGALTGTANPIQLAMTSDMAVTAVFVEVSTTGWALAVSVQGQGAVYPSGGTYPNGTPLTLLASPSAGWQFSHWLGDLSGWTNPAPLTMNASKSITAVFTQIPSGQYTLSIDVQGQGYVVPAGGTFPAGSTVSVTATPVTGWRFDHWAGAVTGTANPASLTMDSNKSLKAVFTQIISTQYTLTVRIQGEGTVSPSGGNYPAGSFVTLTATPSPGWVFKEWQGSASGTNGQVGVQMTADRTVTAVFAVAQLTGYYLTIVAFGPGTVQWYPAAAVPDQWGGFYLAGSQVLLQATPSSGAYFDGWYDVDGNRVSISSSLLVTMQQDVTLGALFVPIGPGNYYLEGAEVWAADGQFLGIISTNPAGVNSLANPSGPYGSKYGIYSIWNEYGLYGSDYGIYSAYNSFSIDPPRIYLNNVFQGYLTKNTFKLSRRDTDQIARDIGRYDVVRN